MKFDTVMARRLVRVAGLAALVIFTVFPVYWMFVTATSTGAAQFVHPPRLLPDMSNLEVFASIASDTELFIWLRNSFLVALGTASVSVALALPMAYAISRYRFFGRAALGMGLFGTQMIPEALLIVPLFSLAKALGLLNSLQGLMIVNTVFILPVLVWMLKAAIDAVPLAIEEAARVDGCGPYAVQAVVVWPLVRPTIAATGILAFFVGWNEYIFAATFISDPALRPASVGMSLFVGEFVTPPATVMAAGLLYAAPAIAFFLLAQRHIVSGLSAGSVKG